MKKLSIIGLTCALLMPLVSNAQKQVAVPTVKVTVTVLDETGNPIQGADAGAAGGLNTPENGSVPKQARGLTDKNGQFTHEIASALGRIATGAECKGYYRGDDGNGYQGVYFGTTDEKVKKAFATGKWEPWEWEIKVTLRQVKNPVPMYVKHFDKRIPTPGQWIGIDLEVGEFVAPHGKGQVADIEILSVGAKGTTRDFDRKMIMRFPGKENGLLPFKPSVLEKSSEFKFPYEAPEAGYISEKSWRFMRKPEPDKIKGGDVMVYEGEQEISYIIRVRSALDQNGNVKRAMYGKIPMPLKLVPRGDGEGTIYFTYYLNPDGTRNLEYDPKENLFKEEISPYAP